MSYFSVTCYRLKFDILSADLCLFSLLMSEITGGLSGIFQELLIPDQILTLCIFTLFVEITQKLILYFESGLIIHTVDATINRKLTEFLCIFGTQYIIGKTRILLGTLIFCIKWYN